MTAAGICLYFEANTIFWREDELPLEPVNSSFESALVLVNLNEMDGIVGSSVNFIKYESTESEVGAKITFSSGVTLEFVHNFNLDTTRVKC